MSPASGLLLEETDRLAAAAWLVLGGEAALVTGVAEADPSRRIIWQPVDHREAIDPGIPESVRIDPPGTSRLRFDRTSDPGSWDTEPPVDVVVLHSPPDRELARWWLDISAGWVANTGRIVVAGANAEGIRSVLADATDLLGPIASERYGRKQRLGVFLAANRPMRLDGPAWNWVPDYRFISWQDGQIERLLESHVGVFASNRLDAGTQVLLDSLSSICSGSVLDVGCGAGPIGFTCAWRGASHVDLVDTNLLAVKAATSNLRLPGLSGCRVLASDVYSALAEQQYDLIVSNPPFHRGKAVDFSVADRLIEEAPGHLEPGGTLLLVANAFLAYGKRMDRVFRSVETVSTTRQYHVIAARDPR